MTHRPLVFVEDLDEPRLSDFDHHHLARVRRLRPGEAIVVGDGRGAWREARFAGDSPEPSGPVQHLPRPAPPVAVGFALVKATKPELVVQKLTELGIDRIQPFVAARSVVRWDTAKASAAHERLVKVAREAAMQCHQRWLPEVAPVVDFATAVAAPGVALAEAGGCPPSLERPFLLVGPEGGWAPDELAAAPATVGLAGETVLRAETAAIAAGALLSALRSGLVLPARP